VTDISNIQPITAAYSSPSNIALVKYWGKRAVQLPANPSLSFTLSAAVTRTKVAFYSGIDSGFRLSINGESNSSFDRKVAEFLAKLHDELDFIHFGFLEIESENTFPHSSGIASSASGMSALALCLCSIEAQLQGGSEHNSFMRKASRLARLGSGSACRSIYGPVALWGSHMELANSHDEYAVALDENHLHPLFRDYGDAILIISSGKKSVSSSLGHKLMDDHPYLEGRLGQAERNISDLLRILKDGDLDGFVQIVENEALSLHGLMMSSTPSFILMEPATIEAIRRIQAFREQSGTHLCFTLDAGPNVHLLYPANEREEVLSFIQKDLVPLCENSYWIDDRLGPGPKPLLKFDE
jgi:diphosphomevalonate decarboxylase